MDTISSLMPGMAMSRPPMSMPSMMAMPSAPPPKPLDLSFVPRSPAIPGLAPPPKPASMFHKPKPNAIPANMKAHMMKKPSQYKPTHPSTIQLPATVTPAKQTIQPVSSSSSLMLPAIGGALLVLFFIMKR